MADFSTNVPQMTVAMADKEIAVNGLVDAASPGTYFARNYNASSALTWAYLGGVILVDGTPTRIANGTLSLTNTATNYIEMTRAGVVSFNTTGFTAGRIPLYQVTAAGGVVTTWLDLRYPPCPTGRLSKSVAGGADVTLTAVEARNDILEFTGLLTASINVIVPVAAQEWIVFNNTTGSFTLTVKTAAGTGILVTQGSRAILYADGTNIVQASNVSAVGANPSATAGLSAVNGSATTFARSDSASAISQAIAPTWTQTHTFNASTVFGNLVDVSGASAGQIKFPATPNLSANANTLDAYAEGTWTATFATGFTTTPTVTMDYTRIGNIVIINGSLQIPSPVTADGNPITITGVPIAPAGSAVVMQIAAPQRTNFTSANILVWRLDSTTLSLVEIAPASASYVGVTSSASANSPFMGSIFMSYKV